MGLSEKLGLINICTLLSITSNVWDSYAYQNGHKLTNLHQKQIRKQWKLINRKYFQAQEKKCRMSPPKIMFFQNT